MIEIGDTISTDSGDKTVVDIETGCFGPIIYFADGSFICESELAP